MSMKYVDLLILMALLLNVDVNTIFENISRTTDYDTIDRDDETE